VLLPDSVVETLHPAETLTAQIKTFMVADGSVMVAALAVTPATQVAAALADIQVMAAALILYLRQTQAAPAAVDIIVQHTVPVLEAVPELMVKAKPPAAGGMVIYILVQLIFLLVLTQVMVEVGKAEAVVVEE
jgi:maltose-binding protein MalE